MKIDFKDIRYAVDTANEITGHYIQYVLQGDHYPRSIDDLLWICETYLQKNISKKELTEPAPHDTVRGTYLSLPTGYVIIMQPGMNFCWRRFVLCKELFHVLLDQPQYRISDISKHLADVQESFPIVESEPGPTTVSEVLAEMAAMQFMYPYARRATNVRAGNGSINYLAIATEYRIPQVLVEKYMSPSYMSNLGALER